jgi:hypothetical protein
VFAIAALILVMRVEGVADDGGRAAWSGSLVAGSAQCMDEMGLRRVLAGERCPYLGGTAGFPFVLGGSEALATTVVMRLTGADPYNAMIPVGIVICLLGFAGGVLLLRLLELPWAAAIAGATVYLIAPFVVGIQIFLGTGSGMLLLPLYAAADLLIVRHLGRIAARGTAILVLVLAGYLLLRCFAVFLDGYTFMMSVLIEAVLLAAGLWRRSLRPWLATVGVVAAANGIAIALYLHVAAGVGLEQPDLTVFRGWGMDLVTAVQPNNQLQWGADVGLEPPRQDLYSDFPSTAWNYVGYLTLALGVAGAVLAVIRRQRWMVAIAAAGLLALVLSLGPALKVDATIKPPYQILAGLMPEGHPDAIELPWAHAFVDLPGLSSMRYPYRWSAVTRLALVALAMFALVRLARRPGRAPTVAAVTLGLLLAAELFPNVELFRRSGLPARAEHSVRDEIVPSVQAVTPRGARVVFVDGTPVANEYLVNPIATLSRVRAWNVGIDKNLFFARGAWPPEVAKLIDVPGGTLTAQDVIAPLRSGAADAVVFLDIDLVQSINAWPTSANAAASAVALEELQRDPAVDVRRARHATAVLLRD